MTSEDDRLKAVIAREKARRAREAEEAAKAETREREKAELRRSAQQRWASLLPQLRAVVATLNEQLKEADIELVDYAAQISRQLLSERMNDNVPAGQ